jgi:Skp family chaperone for outer membrane proteins
MPNRTTRARVAKAVASIVIGISVSTGSVVAFAPPAHAMLPADGGSSTKSLQRQYNKELQRYQQEMQKSQRNWAIIADILKKIGELQRAITQNIR